MRPPGHPTGRDGGRAAAEPAEIVQVSGDIVVPEAPELRLVRLPKGTELVVGDRLVDGHGSRLCFLRAMIEQLSGLPFPSDFLGGPVEVVEPTGILQLTGVEEAAGDRP